MPVGVALGAAAAGDAARLAAALAAGAVVWALSGPVVLGVRFAEHAVIAAAASKARPTSIPRLLTIVRILPPE
jgi:hypothetical protein